MIGITLKEDLVVNLLKQIKKMKNLNELLKKDLIVINGGASLAYRIGQAMAILYDLSFDGSPGVIDTIGGNKAMSDWFGK